MARNLILNIEIKITSEIVNTGDASLKKKKKIITLTYFIYFLIKIIYFSHQLLFPPSIITQFM